MALETLQKLNPVTIPTRAPSSTTNGAAVAAAVSQFLIYGWNNYTPFVPFDDVMMSSMTVVIVWAGAYVTKERRYYMDRQ